MTKRTIRVALLTDSVSNTLHGTAAGRGDGQESTWLPQLAEAMFEIPDLTFRWIGIVPGIANRKDRMHGRHHLIDLPKRRMTVDVLSGYIPTRHDLTKVLAEEDFDILHVWGSERAYPCVLKSSRKPTIYSLNGLLFKLKECGALPEGWRWKLQERHERGWLQDAGTITVESDWARAELLKKHPGKDCRIVIYGVHPSFMNMVWDPDPLDPFVFFGGTVCKGKGVDLLIDAVEQYRRGNWRVEIAGDGPLVDELNKRHVPGVQFLGQLRWEQMKERMSKAWCLVHPTLADSSPNIVKEARMIGMPVVTTPHGGQTELVKDGMNGYIVDPRDPRALAEVLDRMTASLSLAKEMGIRFRDEQRLELSATETAHKFSTIYRDLAVLKGKTQ